MPGQRAALALLILVETAAFAYMSETVVFPAAVAIATLVGWRRRRRYRLSQDRQVILALVTALVFVANWRVNPHSMPDADVMFYLSPFLHALGQFLLVLQTAALYLHRDDEVLPISLPWPGVFVMVSAGDVQVLPPQRFAFQVFALAFVAATATYFAATARAAAGGERRAYGLGKAGVVAALLLGTAFAAWTSAAALHTYEHTLDRLITELLNPDTSPSGAGFPSRSRLGSIAERKSERSQDIALRVAADAEPGYFRGKAYHWLDTVRGYGGRETTQWEEAPEPAATSLATTTGGELLRPAGRAGENYRFELAGPAAPSSRPMDSRPMEIWLEPAQWGTYFLPPLAAEVVSPEDRIRRDFRQVTSADDAGVVTYSVRTGPPPDPARFFDLSAEAGAFSRASLTYVPESVAAQEDLRRLADDVFAGCRTFDEHTAAVENYFRSKYGYALGVSVPPNVDPVVWFLRTRPNAHCEFFAQAAALLLRTRGIPTRYMTGFVVAEKNEFDGLWLARNEHAHAWCEAWDENRGWVVVEATPAAGVPGEAAAPKHRQLWEYLSGLVERFRYRFALGGWPWLARQAAALFTTPAGWLILLLVAGYVTLRLRMRRAATRGRPHPPEVAELRRLLARMDRRLAKAGLTRRPGETLSRFAARVAAETNDPAAAAWYADYAAVRYAGTPDEAMLADLRDRLRSLGPAPKRPREPAAV